MMRPGHWIRIGLLLAVTGASLPALAQNIGKPADYVTWTVRQEPARVAPGQAVHLTLAATIAEGWKMYAMDSPPPSWGVRLRMATEPEGFARQGPLMQSPPATHFDPNFKTDVRYFKGAATFAAAYAVAGDAAPGPVTLGGKVGYQICNDDLGVCLPPAWHPFEGTVVVDPSCAATDGSADPACFEDAAAGAGLTPALPVGTPAGGLPGSGAAAAGESPGAGSLAPADVLGGGGLWAFLMLAFGAGLAALLTPCVFPMIPLTISFFTKHAGDRGRAVRMAGVYGLAIVLTFTGLGVVMALVVGAAGAQTIAANPWVNLFLALVLIVFGLSLLGLFELRVPAGLLNYLNRQGSERQGYTGVVFMGLTLTLVSFSCTAPFVGGLLAAAAGGTWAYPLLGMLAFSAAFALPFVFFALFPKALSALPRSGAWMNAVKVVLGFVELAAALKFLSNADLVWRWGLVSRTFAIAFTVVIFFLTGLYLLGKLRVAHEPPLESVGVGRLLSAILFFGLALYMLPGLLGAPLNALDAYLPPRQGTDVSLVAAFAGHSGSPTAEDHWYVDDLEGAFAEAEARGRPVFIDFTGYTCTNCREMEANVFPRPEVAERFERDYVLLRLYTDDLKRGEEFLNYQLRLTGTVALPTYAVVNPDGRVLVKKVSGLLDVDAFVAFLDEGSAGYRQMALASSP